jgi:hypothetical protein
MKRLLNAYALHRDLGILAGSDVFQNLQKRKQLVLWTIVPAVADVDEAVAENLEYVDVIQVETPLEQASEKLRKLFNDAPECLPKLLIRQSVKAVFIGQGVGIGLSPSIIREFAGLRTSNSSAAAVG